MRARHDFTASSIWTSLVCLGVASLVGACGGSAAAPETPAEEPTASSEEPATAESEPAAAEPEASAEPEPPKETPRTILVREGTLFMLDHAKSDMGIKVEEACKKKSGEDVAKHANCVSKEMGKLPREGFSFDEDDEGKWWYVRFGIEKNVQVIYNKVEVEVGEPSGSKITLTPVGKDVAKRKKGTVPKELNFEVPDEYTVVLHDPTRGRMEFEPKLGILEEGQAQ